MVFLFRLLMAGWALLITSGLQAQQYHFLNYSVDDGLAQTQVFSIAQNSKGYLWIATIGGVSRFDGIEFRNFSTRDGLYKNQVRCMAFDHTDALWLGSDGGYSYFNGHSFSSYSLPEPYTLVQINSILPTSNGSVWLGTDGLGIIRFNGSNPVEVIDSLDGLHNMNVRSIVFGPDSTMWIGTREGLFARKNGHLEQITIDTTTSISISNLALDENGHLWVSTFGRGVYHIRNGTINHLTSHEGLISDWIRETIPAGNKRVWFVSRYGASELENGKITSYSNKNGLPYLNLRTGLFDKEGNIWLGSDGKGIYKFAGKAFVNYTRSDGLPDELILAINQAPNGDLYLGSLQEGVIILSNDSLRRITTKEGLPHNTVWSITGDLAGNIWFATSLGLARLGRDGVITPYTKTGTDDLSLSDTRVTAVFTSSDGTVWAGTRNGVTAISPQGIFRSFTANEGLNAAHIRAIVEDSNGNIWLGAENGAFRFDGNRFTHYPIEASLPQGAKVYSITKDILGKLWFGTEGGLYHYDGAQHFEYIKLSEDSRADFINFLLCDKDSNLWIGTNYGIFELDLPLYYGKEKVVLRNHTYHEGIRNLECNLNASYQDKDGNCWFGTGGGLLRLNYAYANELINSMPPRLLFGELLLFKERMKWEKYASSINQTTGLPENLRLPWNKNHLTFSFIGISFRNPDFVKYQYKLEGFDETWSPLTPFRIATYSNLPPGEYSFRLKAINSAGVWTEQPISYSFVILPPFWTTTWFYLSVAGSVILIIWLLVKWRVRVLKRKQETEQLVYKSRLLELEQQSLNASMNRHFIFNALNSIQYYINRQDKLSANKYLSSFAKLIRKNLDSSTGNTMVTLFEELDRLQLYLELEHMRFQDKFEFHIHIDEDIDLEQHLVPAMMLQPFVENSIWHGILPMEKQGKIEVRLQLKEQKIHIIIEDNGIGVEQSRAIKSESSHQHSSKGMQITTGRIELLKKMSRRNIKLIGPYQINDKNNNPCGTRVEIWMDIE